MTLLETMHPDQQVIDALRAGDEDAFACLLRTHHGAMVRVAAGYVPCLAVAEEVAQDTWMAVIKGISSFEGRHGSSLKTWIFAILVNQARTRGERERRTTPLSSLPGASAGDDGAGTGERAVEPDRFLPAGHRWSGHWASPPQRFDPTADDIAGGELHDLIAAAIAELPGHMGQVVGLRDVHGWTSAEVCRALDLSEANQRVLLHRGRSKLRAVLERHLDAR